MELSWNNVRIKSLHFPALAQRHCSIDLSFSFARGARRSRKLNSAGKQLSTLAPTASERRAVVQKNRQSRSPNAYFSRLFAPGLSPRPETLSSQKILFGPSPLRIPN